MKHPQYIKMTTLDREQPRYLRADSTLGKTHLIAFTGYAGSGKDTCATVLATHVEFAVMAFADPLRAEVSAAFNVPIALLVHPTKKNELTDEMALHRAPVEFQDAVIVHLLRKGGDFHLDSEMRAPRTPRQVIQWWGTEYRRRSKGLWFYLVTAVGQKRIWTKLTRVRDGMPALYRELADREAREIAPDAMGAVIADWLKEVSSRHVKQTQANETYMCKEIGARFAEFRASEIRPPDVSEFLMAHRDRPRTHNGYRAQIRELMRFAEEKGWRDPGTNPVDSIRTMPLQARDRYITDSELRRIKVAAMYSDDERIVTGGKRRRTRSGPMICALIDMAYLTGQRIGDLLTLQWSQVTKDGIAFKPSKVAGSTGARVLIERTPALNILITRLEALARPRKGHKVEQLDDFKRRAHGFVFTTQQGYPYKYSGASTAWSRAVKSSGVEDVHFHDLRAKALTDKERREGMQQARRMGGHSTEAQLADYVRHKQAQGTSATR